MNINDENKTNEENESDKKKDQQENKENSFSEDFSEDFYKEFEKNNQNIKEKKNKENNFEKEINIINNLSEKINDERNNILIEIDNKKKKILELLTIEKEFVERKVYLDFIEIIDSLEMILSQSSSNNSSLEKNLASLLKRSKFILKKNKIEKIITKENDEFNETIHNAISTAESPDFESNRIMKVLQDGYTINDVVLRYTLVIVSE